MENYVVDIQLRVEIPAPNPGMAATVIAETLKQALASSAPFPTRGLTMQAAAWELPAAELTNEHT